MEADRPSAAEEAVLVVRQAEEAEALQARLEEEEEAEEVFLHQVVLPVHLDLQLLQLEEGSRVEEATLTFLTSMFQQLEWRRHLD